MIGAVPHAGPCLIPVFSGVGLLAGVLVPLRMDVVVEPDGRGTWTTCRQIDFDLPRPTGTPVPVGEAVTGGAEEDTTVAIDAPTGAVVGPNDRPFRGCRSWRGRGSRCPP